MFVNVDDAGNDLTMLIYGDNRSGKTHLLASAYELEELNPIMIDADRGVATWKKIPGSKSIKVWQFDPAKAKLSQLNEVLKLVEENKCQLLMFDSLSFFMHEVVVEKSPTGKTPIETWNWLFTNISMFLTNLSKICRNYIFTAFGEPITIRGMNEIEPKTIGIEPMVYGHKFPKYLMNYFNIIAYIETKIISNKLTTTLNVRPEGFYVTGDRLGKLTKLTNPSLKDIYNTIKEV